MLAFAAVPHFLITMALIPVIGCAVIWVVREMIMQSIGGLEGIVALSILIAMFVGSIVSPSPLVAGASLLSILALACFFPFAEAQMGKRVGRELNATRIDRAHEAIAAKPDNAAAWFELAHAMHERGWQGHAIAVAEQTLNGLSADPDPFTQNSLRSLFWSEELALKQWKKSADPRLCRPIKCPLCGAPNPPGPIACAGCGKPYLLELSRKSDTVTGLVGRLVLGWALVAGAIAAGAFAGSMGFGVYGVLVSLAVVGAVLWWLFRSPLGDATQGWHI